MKPLNLTIAIPVKNEEKNLPGCLAAIGKDLAANVVVIDSGSTDSTREIAAAWGASVVDFKWDGKFPKKRNWFLRNHTPGTEWIFFLDADEYLTDAFKEDLRTQLSASDKAAYWLKYSTFFMGKELKGGYPLRKLALFRNGAGEYEHIEENNWSNLDMEVHEHPIIKGKIGHLKSKIDHQDFKGIQNFIRKHDEYADWEAARFLKTKDDIERKTNWTWRQRLKYLLLGTVWVGPSFFMGSFFLLGGFKDGRRGLAFALFKLAYFNQVYCKILERKTPQKKKQPPVRLTQIISKKIIEHNKV